jgi:lysophospholipase L1-like esterase
MLRRSKPFLSAAALVPSPHAGSSDMMSMIRLNTAPSQPAAAPFAPATLTGLAWQVGFGGGSSRTRPRPSGRPPTGTRFTPRPTRSARRTFGGPDAGDGGASAHPRPLHFRRRAGDPVPPLDARLDERDRHAAQLPGLHALRPHDRDLECDCHRGDLGLYSGGTTSGRIQFNAALPTDSEGVVWSGSSAGSGGAVGYGAAVVTLTGTASALTLRVNGVQVATGTAANAGTFGLSTLGSMAGNYLAHASFAGLLGYGRALSPSEITALEAYATAYASVGTTFDPAEAAFAVIGDSLSCGYGTNSDAAAWPAQMFASMTNGATYQRSCANMAHPGSTVAQWLTAAPVRVDPYYDARRPANVCFVWAGTNDGPSPTSYANLKALCAARQAAGWAVAVMDMLPRGTYPPGNDPNRGTFNASLAGDFPTPAGTNLRSGAPYASYLIQLSGDTNIGAEGSQSNTTYYQTDLTHLTVAGYGVVAGYAKTAMKAIGYT